MTPMIIPVFKSKNTRDPEKFSGDDLFWYWPKVEKPLKFCCDQLEKNYQYIEARYDGNNCNNFKIIGVGLATNPEWGDTINLKFCPSCGSEIIFQDMGELIG